MRVEVEGVTVRYGARRAVDGASFVVEPGSVYALLGRNGAGKSSLIKVLLGQRRPDGGRVAVGGRDPWRQRAALMAEIGATPETPDAPPAASAAEIARSVAPLYPSWDRRGFEERLARFGIDPRRRFVALSRGQKALVMLALALAHRPRLLVLDDPTLGLDPVARRWVFEDLVGELADRGTTVLLASHDLDGVERVATHAGFLVEGRLVAGGAIEALRAAPGSDGRPTGSLEERFVALTATGGGAA